jgi:hypothetical protein
MVSLPFPLSSKKWEGKACGDEPIRSAGRKRRRAVALIAEGFSSETDPAGVGAKRRSPAGIKLQRGFGTGRVSRIRILASALGPA